MDTLKLGQIITSHQEKDATHIALAPVVAAQSLKPAQRVCLASNGKAILSFDATDYVGIVDPFLRKTVNPGQKFWLWLEPGSITSLKHVWDHPAFEAAEKSAAQNNLNDSIEWLKDYAIRHVYNDDYSEGKNRDVAYESLLGQVRGGDLTFYGQDCHGLGDVPDSHELFGHLSNVLGRPITDKSFEYFSCSC